jgi:hypothetical protein
MFTRKRTTRRCSAEQNEYYRLYLYSGKVALAAIYLRRVWVVGRCFAAALTHVSTVVKVWASRDVPWCGALSLLQKPQQYKGVLADPPPRSLNSEFVRCLHAWCVASSHKHLNMLVQKWRITSEQRRCAPSPQEYRRTPAPSRAAGGPRRSFLPQAQAA